MKNGITQTQMHTQGRTPEIERGKGEALQNISKVHSNLCAD